MIKSYYHEALNGHLFVLATYAYFIFLRFLWLQRSDSYENNRPAFAIGLVLLGEAVIRGSYWWVRHQINADDPVNIASFYFIVAVGGCIQAVGIVYVIKVFSPQDCGPMSWVWAIILSMAWTYGWMFIDIFM